MQDHRRKSRRQNKAWPKPEKGGRRQPGQKDAKGWRTQDRSSRNYQESQVTTAYRQGRIPEAQGEETGDPASRTYSPRYSGWEEKVETTKEQPRPQTEGGLGKGQRPMRSGDPDRKWRSGDPDRKLRSSDPEAAHQGCVAQEVTMARGGRRATEGRQTARSRSKGT